MLDEKGTAAAMKAAWRKGGYRFVLSGGILSVRAESWGFQGALENIPNKALGLLAEHFGCFPEDGDCFEIKKDEAEQSVMYDQEASWWEQQRALFDEEHDAMLQTPLLLNGYEIWQEQRGLKTQLVDPDRTRIIDSDYRQQAAVVAGHPETILWKTMSGTIAYVTATYAEEGKLDRLDGWPWCGEGS